MTGGNVVELYEPTPGHILISELGRGDSPPVLQHQIDNLSATDAFRALAPDAPVPAELSAAAKRAELLPRTTVQARRAFDGSELGDRSGIRPQSLSAAAIWFQGKFCAPLSGFSRSWCLLDWWNGAWESGSGYDFTQAAVYADIGDVQFSWTGDFTSSFTVGQGFWRSFRATAGFLSTLSELYQVTNATNNRFDFAGAFD
jgi:hypothetical protein